MKNFSTFREFSEYRKRIPEDKTVGFVPTMGALHQGHLELVKQSKLNCDLTIVSIFVNAAQFNDPKDFEKYPRNLTRDLALLKTAGVDVVFTPEDSKELGPSEFTPTRDYNLNGIDQQLEGKFRPGHFDAVVKVVERFLNIVKPHFAFFGLKDFQQYSIINHFVKNNNLPFKIVGVETVREDGGLAMSSRNERLSSQERTDAHNIFDILNTLKEHYLAGGKPSAICKDGKEQLRKIQGVREVEYLTIASAVDLSSIDTPNSNNARIFVALHLGEVRLIDNISLKP